MQLYASRLGAHKAAQLATGSPSKTLKHLALALMAASALAVAAPGAAKAAGAPTSPTAFFGFELGADGKYAGWDQEVAYYYKLAGETDRMKVREVGKSTGGLPFLEITISSPANLAKAARYQEISKKLSDPRGLSDAQIKALVEEGKVVDLVSLGQHSTEVASSQVGPLLVYQLVTGNDETTKIILDNAIFVLIPSFNPDGLAMVKAWTDKTAGTPYQGVGTPESWHLYAGHDNNRDAYMMNLAESKDWAVIAYKTWFPQIYQDTHQQGAYASRIFLPPKTEPILPDVQPIVWRETMLVGAAMATQLETAGIKGVETEAGSYTGWQMPTFHGMTPSRNIVGFHTESASAKLIWPLEVKPSLLQAADRGRPVTTAMMNFPNPWPGGTWRMGDIVKQQKIAILATLEAAARQKTMFLGNMALMAQNQIKLGQTQAPYAHVIPAAQYDPGTTAKMISMFIEANVDVTKATKAMTLGGVAVQPGDYVIRSDQPMRGYVHSLLVPYMYPDNPTTRKADGSPLQPKDFSSTNLGELMGVKVEPVTAPLTAADVSGLQLMSAPPKLAGSVTGSGSAGWLLTPAWNDSFQAVTQVLGAGGKVSRLTAPMGAYPAGTFWIAAGGKVNAAMIQKLSADLGLPFEAAPAAPKAPSFALKTPRVGVYHRYHGGNPDEGWTRFIFDTWKVPYSRVDADDIKAKSLSAKYDVIILPADSTSTLMGRPPSTNPDDEGGGAFPPEFEKSLGEPGVAALQAFARAGGTIVFMDDSTDLAITKFGIPVTNTVKGMKSKDYYAPGSMLHMKFDPGKPLSYGMPADGLVLSEGGAAFAVGAPAAGQKVSVSASYPAGKILQSGWLIGESNLANKASLVDVGYGKGRLVLTGFGPQRRAETHGTYKVLFNAIYIGGAPQ